MNEIKLSRASRKVFRGVVVSDKMNKTRVVSVERTTRHSGYAKTLKKTEKFYAHDEANETHAGDTVEIMSTRPLSSLKRWRIFRIVAKAGN